MTIKPLKSDPALLELRERVLSVFDDLRRVGLAPLLHEVRAGSRGITHLTLVHVETGSSAFVAFGPVSARLDAATLTSACALRGVVCTWEGGGHLALVAQA